MLVRNRIGPDHWRGMPYKEEKLPNLGFDSPLLYNLNFKSEI